MNKLFAFARLFMYNVLCEIDMGENNEYKLQKAMEETY